MPQELRVTTLWIKISKKPTIFGLKHHKASVFKKANSNKNANWSAGHFKILEIVSFLDWYSNQENLDNKYKLSMNLILYFLKCFGNFQIN